MDDILNLLKLVIQSRLLLEEKFLNSAEKLRMTVSSVK